MRAGDRETAIREQVRDALVAEGYEVVIEPNRLLVPKFLGEYRPDALAFRADKNLVVEIANQSPTAERRLRELQQKVAAQAGWDLRLVWSSPGARSSGLKPLPPALIEATLDDVEKLVLAGQLRAAFLMAWSCLEAIGRTLQPTNLSRPQTPARLTEQLAHHGAISPDEAEKLREMISKRNRLVHGDLRTEIRRRDIEFLVSVVRGLAVDIASAA